HWPVPLWQVAWASSTRRPRRSARSSWATSGSSPHGRRPSRRSGLACGASAGLRPSDLGMLDAVAWEAQLSGAGDEGREELLVELAARMGEPPGQAQGRAPAPRLQVKHLGPEFDLQLEQERAGSDGGAAAECGAGAGDGGAGGSGGAGGTEGRSGG